MTIRMMATPIEAPPRPVGTPEAVLPPVAERPPDVAARPVREKMHAPQGPVKLVHAFWLAGMSCDGCSISATGATNPSVEDLLLGVIPGLPKVVLHHPVLSLEVGEDFIHPFEMAQNGELDAPY
ncbi:MAG: hypothetical protein M3Z66_06295, partial [Chloroflexota bacterium]|nr:hypothetical protein [Chloroflexota bacterium]